jgi:hypothetical protein
MDTGICDETESLSEERRLTILVSVREKISKAFNFFRPSF